MYKKQRKGELDKQDKREDGKKREEGGRKRKGEKRRKIEMRGREWARDLIKK